MDMDKLFGGMALVDEPQQPQPEAPQPVEEPVEEEEVVEEQEEQVVAPVIEKLPENEETDIEVPTAIKYLASKWGEMGITEDVLQEDQFKAVVDVVEGLLGELKETKKQKGDLEKHPIVKLAKIDQKINDMWDTNIASWEEELCETIPDEIKLIKGMGKKQTKEIVEFIKINTAEFMRNKVQAGKNVSNPLLVLAPKISNKIKELSATKVEKEPAKPDPKRLVNLSSGGIQDSRNEIQQRPIAKGMTPTQESFAKNMTKMFGF